MDGTLPGETARLVRPMPEMEDWFHQYNAWSASRHGLWNNCRRAYHYRYIAAGLKDPGDIDVPHIRELKSLVPKNVIKGKLVHEVIQGQIDRLASGTVFDEEDAERQYTLGVQAYWDNALERVVEFHNSGRVDDAFFDGVLLDGLRQLQVFFRQVWPQLEGCDYLRHEEFDRFNVGNVAATVKLDYVAGSRDDDAIHVFDWKTGRFNPRYVGKSRLQMGCYVLWAMGYYGKQPEGIRSELVYLSSGQRVPFSFSMVQLRDIENVIKRDFAEMNRTYDIDGFPPNPRPWQCSGCNFSTVCPRSVGQIKSGGR